MGISVTEIIDIIIGDPRDQIIEIIEEHMKGQPYDITCSECGGNMVIDADIDGDFDLLVVVHPCDCGKGGTTNGNTLVP